MFEVINVLSRGVCVLVLPEIVIYVTFIVKFLRFLCCLLIFVVINAWQFKVSWFRDFSFVMFKFYFAGQIPLYLHIFNLSFPFSWIQINPWLHKFLLWGTVCDLSKIWCNCSVCYLCLYTKKEAYKYEDYK